MTRDEVTAVLIDELGQIAPETDASRIDPNAELREELDIDSMDFLNLVAALSERARHRHSGDRLPKPRLALSRGRLPDATKGVQVMGH